ncbi:MAG: flagellar type III secretion system pore protein FliP, partial [Bryobacteraceae bacterium]
MIYPRVIYRRVPLAILLFLLAVLPAAADTAGTLGLPQTGGSGGTLSMPMQVILTLTLLTILPGAMMCITPFLRITIVLHFLRQALGTQTVPSNQVLVGLALFLSMVIIQ